MGTDNKTFPVNWLLLALLAVSIAIHGAILLGTPGAPKVEKTSLIPVALQKDMRPPVRDVPKPPPRSSFPETRKPHSPLAPDPTVPSVAPVPEMSSHIQPVDRPLPEALKPDSAPTAPQTAAQSPSAQPEKEEPSETQTSGTRSGASYEGGAVDSRMMDYFNDVRRKIESCKKYPEISRRQQMEGKVVVAFVINPDGTVSDLTVAKGSGFTSLDEAALNAVHGAAPFPPLPEAYFKGPAPVKVPISFEMIR